MFALVYFSHSEYYPPQVTDLSKLVKNTYEKSIFTEDTNNELNSLFKNQTKIICENDGKYFSTKESCFKVMNKHFEIILNKLKEYDSEDYYLLETSYHLDPDVKSAYAFINYNDHHYKWYIVEI